MTASTQMSASELKPFPMLSGPAVPWALGEVLYEAYATLHGRSQSIERIAERGGLGWREVGHIFDELKRRNVRKYDELRANACQAADTLEGVKEALRPFARDFVEAGVPDTIPDDARFGDIDCDGSNLTVGDFRRAVSALSPMEEIQGERG